MQRHPSRQLATWIWLLALAPAAAPAQIFVYPRHADKSQVRYYEFNGQHVDILVGPQASKKLADPRTLTTLPTHEEAVDKSSNLGGPAQPFTQAPAEGLPRTEHLPPATPTSPAPDGGMPRDGGTSGSADAGTAAAPRDAGALAQADAGVNPWYVWPAGARRRDRRRREHRPALRRRAPVLLRARARRGRAGRRHHRRLVPGAGEPVPVRPHPDLPVRPVQQLPGVPRDDAVPAAGGHPRHHLHAGGSQADA